MIKMQRSTVAIIGTVVAVLAIAGGVSAVALNRHLGTSSAAPGGPASTGTPTSPPNSGVPGSGSSYAGPASPATCPQSLPSISAGAGSSTALFPSGVSSIEVCLYTAQHLAGSKPLTGADAQTYARKLDAAPTRAKVCPLYMTQNAIALLATTTGQLAPPVVGRIGGCTQLTNGSASREAGDLINQLTKGMTMGGAAPSPLPPVGAPSVSGVPRAPLPSLPIGRTGHHPVSR